MWQKTRARNEALDVRVYALAAFVNLNANLDQLAKSLKAKSVDENKPETPPKADPYKAIHNRRPRTQNFQQVGRPDELKILNLSYKVMF